MDKAQALQEFWESFGLPAYDQYSVPDDAVFPYITYEVATDSMGHAIPLTASLWYRSTSWKEISLKTDEIAKYIGEHGSLIRAIDGGYMYLYKGSAFAQRMNDPADDMVKRMYLNILVEFLTAY